MSLTCWWRRRSATLVPRACVGDLAASEPCLAVATWLSGVEKKRDLLVQLSGAGYFLQRNFSSSFDVLLVPEISRPGGIAEGIFDGRAPQCTR